MYQIENGILYKDGKKTFALGESYYPSFHPCKFPVAPDGDRMGEMVKDLKMMAEAGFNHVRFAALGEPAYDEATGKAGIDAPFVDAMIREAHKNDLSVSVRLNGFSVNLRGFSDGDMIDENGNVPDYAWSDFVRTSPNHKGILEDNYTYTRDLAEHFFKFPATVGFQIYNEPKFPRPDMVTCDYNKHSVDAYRKWLTEQGILSEEEAKYYQPPKNQKEQSPEMWTLWRTFSMNSMAGFLDTVSRGAKAGSELPTFTCLTSDTACKTNPRRCVDAFANAGSMDFVGYTIYKHAWGAEYYPMCLDGDMFQSAAESEGKEAWCIELDSRTYIPPSVYNKGTYATIGSGVKGIVYYQWRGDCPVPGVPYPNSCGILNYDGTKTANFDNAVEVNRWISSVNDLLIHAHRAQEGIGLFYSPYGAFYCDALENGNRKEGNTDLFNAALVCYNQLYTDLRKAGYTVTIVDGQHLCENRANLKVLVVPDMAHLSEAEKEQIDRFYESGGQVFVNENVGFMNAFASLYRYDKIERGYKERVFLPPCSPYDLEDVTGRKPICKSGDARLGVQVLVGEGYTLLVLTNTSVVQTRMDAKVTVSIPFQSAEFTAIDGQRSVEINGSELTVRDISDGGMMILR